MFKIFFWFISALNPVSICLKNIETLIILMHTTANAYYEMTVWF